jgi:D-sedoheptulose 7-phosphate isomerase
MMKNKILIELIEAKTVLNKVIESNEVLTSIEKAAEIMVTAIKNGNKIIACGNGGSMSDAMHFASELTGRYRENRKPLPAIAISDPGHLSCVANDYGYEWIFSRWIQAHAKPGDVILGISTSGNSDNVLNAHIRSGIDNPCIVLTGNNAGKWTQGYNVTKIVIPYSGYADRIQEMHIKIIHILVMLIEDSLKPKTDETD